MINNRNGIFSVFFCAAIFTLFFHRQELGLNVFLFETLILCWLYFIKQIDFRSGLLKIYGAGLLTTAVAVVISYSSFSIVVNFIAFFIFIGALIYPKAKSTVTTMFLAFCNIYAAQLQFFQRLSDSTWYGRRNGGTGNRIKIFIIPLLIIFCFIVIYSLSNPFFEKLVSKASDIIQTQLANLFGRLDILVLFTFILGLAISNGIFFRTKDDAIVEEDRRSNDALIRTKGNALPKFKPTGLKDEYKAGVFLLIILNVMLLLVNILDVYWVWFNFKWNGQYLKQFVHEGTYLLLLSIIFSIAIVLFFFRGNVNFYSKNLFLKRLSYIWLAQNGVLTLSVAIRNFHYIQYFALAYKRIALVIFLLLTIYGLYTVYLKVSQKKSAFYLFRTNAFAVYVVLVLSSIVNWESLIVQYNFSHSANSFVHLEYLSGFPDKTLPYLDKTMAELSEMKTVQKGLFPFEEKDVTDAEFYNMISMRKQKFKTEWESESILSWNLPEYTAYCKLNEQIPK